MNQLIRNLVHNILLETRANLSIRPMMKQWVQVAVDHGINDTKALCTKLPGSLHDNVKNAVGLKVPKSKSHLVFEGLTPETQEWVLKHWKTKEYFANMISGVILGIVGAYSEYPNAVGMKGGNTMISLGTYNKSKKTWVGGASGYLTMKKLDTFSPSHLYSKGTDLMFLDVPDNSSITIFNVDSLKVDKSNFKSQCLRDLKKSDSTLYHEFQHWFQETVMFADERLKRPTKASETGGSYSKPKDFKNQIKPVPRVMKMLLKKVIKGVDFTKPKDHPNVSGAPMYKIIDQAAFVDSFQKFWDDGSIWPNELYKHRYVKEGQSINDGGWMKDFIENTLKTSLTPEGEKLLFHRDGPIAAVESRVKWAHDSDLLKYFGKNNSGKLPDRFDDPYRKAFKAASGSVQVFLIPKSHAIKAKGAFTEEIKPNKKLMPASLKRLSKENMYVIFGRGGAWNSETRDYKTSQNTGRGQKSFEKSKNPLYAGQRLSWDKQWVEFDAESRNYLAAAVDTVSEFETFKKALVRSDDEKLAKLLLEQIKTKLRGRIDRRITNENEAELISMCDRIADKFVEEAEAMTLFDFQDNNPHPNLYKSPNNPSTEENVQIWLDGGNYFYSRYGDYFKYIKDRVFGEV